MFLCRFETDRQSNRFGVVQGNVVKDVTSVLDTLSPYRYPLPNKDVVIEALPALRQHIEVALSSATSIHLDEVRLLSPVANPHKIIAAPVNYRDHLEEAKAQTEINHGSRVEEIQRIGLFLKATSSLVGPSAGVAIQHADRRNDHEVELVAIVGKPGRNIRRDQAFDHIAAYSIGLDMTVRGPQERSLRKSIDTYSVLGPWMVTADAVENPSALDMWITVNGETRQRANTRDLIIGIPELVEFASSYYTLYPGDLIFTGTPAGVGAVHAGDTMIAGIADIGEMTVKVGEA